MRKWWGKSDILRGRRRGTGRRLGSPILSLGLREGLRERRGTGLQVSVAFNCFWRRDVDWN
jgi:hypothetical protein